MILLKKSTFRPISITFISFVFHEGASCWRFWNQILPSISKNFLSNPPRSIVPIQFMQNHKNLWNSILRKKTTELKKTQEQLFFDSERFLFTKNDFTYYTASEFLETTRNSWKYAKCKLETFSMVILPWLNSCITGVLMVPSNI